MRWGIRHRSGRLLALAALLGLLYAGRDVLIPLVAALMLSLLLAPVVRALEKLRLGRAAGVIIAVLGVTLAGVAATLLLGRELLDILQRTPDLQANLQHRIEPLEQLLGASGVFTGISALAPEQIAALGRGPVPGGALHALLPDGGLPDLLRAAGGALASGTILLLILTFVLFEREALRDRFIRLLGSNDIHRTTIALDDASARLSRYFGSQFVVNVAFGACVGLALALLHHPEALLCAMLAAGLRFLPYFGVGIVASIAAGLAAALDPGWSLPVCSFGAILLVDLLLGQFLEPHLYGHATGLSPLSVVLAAIFWSTLWGPAGLLLSTPLTVCVLVAGRHVEGLGTLELLLGNAPPLTAPQSFYQRALAGDTHEILANARAFLRKHDLPGYFDRVLLPALHLARLDEHRLPPPGARTASSMRRVVLEVALALLPDARTGRRRRAKRTLLDEVGPGRLLRIERERLAGPWQGPLGVPTGSVQLCLSLGTDADDLAAELLARLLRARGIDARHFALRELEADLPPGADPDGVSIVYLVSAFPPEAPRDRAEPLHAVRQRLPHAHILRVQGRGVELRVDAHASVASAAPTTDSLGDALAIGLEHALAAP